MKAALTSSSFVRPVYLQPQLDQQPLQEQEPQLDQQPLQEQEPQQLKQEELSFNW